MMMKLATATLLAATLIACTTTTPSLPAETPDPGPDLVIHVVASGSMPEMGLPGVQVTAITGTGTLVSYGNTFGGDIRLAKEKLESDNAVVLLFCHPVFQCGARRIGEDHMLQYDEIWIDLVPITLR
jgi:hypothetical protein